MWPLNNKLMQMKSVTYTSCTPNPTSVYLKLLHFALNQNVNCTSKNIYCVMQPSNKRKWTRSFTTGHFSYGVVRLYRKYWHRNCICIQGRRQGKSLEGAREPRGSRGQRPRLGSRGQSPLVGVRGRSPLKLKPFQC